MIDFSSVMTIKIGDIESLLGDYDVEIESPDGWVSVTDFFHKGMYDEYVLETDDGVTVNCNANHLFETRDGWVKAHDRHLFGRTDYLCKTGFCSGVIRKTGNKIPIVDIHVNHPNHRYYTNGISSHNSGVGKSAVKCSLAADYLQQGYNVLYVTLELAEKRVAERIDANMFNQNVSEIKNIPKAVFMNKISKLNEKTHGKLVIKEYPTGTASAATIRILLDELKNKKGFVPDVIFVDYLGICASARYRNSSTVNTYTYQTSVAEELRALAVEMDILLWSSVQTNRAGMNASDYDIEAIADSTGPYKTCDSLLAIIRTDDLNAMNQMILKQLKNRFGDLNYFRKFIVGMDFARMKMFNVENSAHLAETTKEIENEKETTGRRGNGTKQWGTSGSAKGAGQEFDFD
jgi:hypothetical protein